MAIQTNITTPQGLDLAGTYIRIQEVKIKHRATEHTPTDDYIELELGFWVNQNAYNTFKEPIKIEYLTLSYTDTETISFGSLYTYLRTLPEFAGAVDC